MPFSGGVVGRRFGPSSFYGLSLVKTSIVQPASQLVTMPDRLLPLIVRPLSAGRRGWLPRLPPSASAMPLPTLLLVVVWVIRLLIVPGPFTSTPLTVLLIRLLPS